MTNKTKARIRGNLMKKKYGEREMTNNRMPEVGKRYRGKSPLSTYAEVCVDYVGKEFVVFSINDSCEDCGMIEGFAQDYEELPNQEQKSTVCGAYRE